MDNDLNKRKDEKQKQMQLGDAAWMMSGMKNNVAKRKRTIFIKTM